eukprot:4656011-Alexandrium_andersonii.AAC.1
MAALLSLHTCRPAAGPRSWAERNRLLCPPRARKPLRWRMAGWYGSRRSQCPRTPESPPPRPARGNDKRLSGAGGGTE